MLRVFFLRTRGDNPQPPRVVARVSDIATGNAHEQDRTLSRVRVDSCRYGGNDSLARVVRRHGRLPSRVAASELLERVPAAGSDGVIVIDGRNPTRRHHDRSPTHPAAALRGSGSVDRDPQAASIQSVETGGCSSTSLPQRNRLHPRPVKGGLVFRRRAVKLRSVRILSPRRPLDDCQVQWLFDDASCVHPMWSWELPRDLL